MQGVTCQGWMSTIEREILLVCFLEKRKEKCISKKLKFLNRKKKDKIENTTMKNPFSNDFLTKFQEKIQKKENNFFFFFSFNLKI